MQNNDRLAEATGFAPPLTTWLILRGSATGR
jgi:hypothetical protein